VGHRAPLGGRSFSIRLLRKLISSLWALRVASNLVCLLCICHCIRRTKPRITKEMVIKRPSIHCKVLKRSFISARRSSMRLFKLLSSPSMRLLIALCPSSSLVSFSIISLSVILGAFSTALATIGANNITATIKTITTFFMFSPYQNALAMSTSNYPVML